MPPLCQSLWETHRVLTHNWPTSGLLCVCVTVSVESHLTPLPMAILTLLSEACTSLSHTDKYTFTNTHAHFHTTEELIKHNVPGWEQDWGKDMCACVCGWIMQSARWERDRQVNSDSSNTVNRGRASEKRDIKRKCIHVRLKDRQTEEKSWRGSEK